MNIFKKINESVIPNSKLKNLEKMSFDDKSKLIIQAINKSVVDIKQIKKALDPYKKDNLKEVNSLLKNIKKAETLSNKFLDKEEAGTSVTPKEAKKMIDLYDSINDAIKRNEKLQIKDQTLGLIIKKMRSKDSKEEVDQRTLSDRLKKISGVIGESAKDFLVSNSSSISTQGAGDVITGGLSAISPELAIVTKTLGTIVDFDNMFSKTKEKMSGFFGKKEDKEIKEMNDGIEERYFDHLKIEEKRHKEITDLLEGIKKKPDGDSGFGLAMTPKSLFSTMGKILKVAGLATAGGLGAYGVYKFSQRMKNRDEEEPFFGKEKGVKGLLDSKASDYLGAMGSGAVGGAAIGKLIGPLFGPIGLAAGTAIGAGIGAVTGIIATAWNDKAVGKWFSSIGDKIVGWWNSFKTSVKNAFDKVKNGFNSIKNWVSSIFSLIGDFFGSSWNKIKDVVSNVKEGVLDKVVSVFGSLFDKVANLFGSIKEIFSGGLDIDFGSVFDSILSALEKVFSFITGPFVSLYKKFTGDKEVQKLTEPKLENKIDSITNLDTKSPSLETLQTSNMVNENTENVVNNFNKTITKTIENNEKKNKENNKGKDETKNMMKQSSGSPFQVNDIGLISAYSGY